MNIMVTGGAGFIGTHLIKALVGEYPEAVIASLDNYSSGRFSNHLPEPYYVAMHTGSLSPKNNDPIELLFHFGEYSRIATSFEDSEKVIQSNIMGTANMLEVWKQSGATLVYSGSSSIFADKYANPYTYAKAHNVELIKLYAKWFNLPYIITYFYNVYGQGQISTGRMSTVIGIFLEAYKKGDPLPIVSPGTQKRDFTHVDDIVSGIMLAVKSSKRNVAYHLCTEQAYSIMEIALAFPGAEVEMVPYRRGERFDSIGSSEKARQELGWVPKNNVITWIKEQLK